MQHALGRALLATTGSLLMLCRGIAAAPAGSARIEPFGPASVSPLGAGATALCEDADALFENPAALAALSRSDAAAHYGSGTAGAHLLRLGFGLPSLEAHGLGVGYTRREVPAQGLLPAERRSAWHLAVARSLGGGVAIGSALKLQTRASAGIEDPSFGADVALHWGQSAAARWSLGAVLRNALRSGERRSEALLQEPRRVAFGAAYARPLLRGAGAALCVGLDAAPRERGALWLGARLRRGTGLELEAGCSRDAVRLGSGVALGRVHLAYLWTTASGDRSQALGVHVGLGRSLDELRTSRDAAEETRVAGSLRHEIARREALQVRQGLDEAEQAVSMHEYARASELYRNVLTWRDDEPRALAGLRRARFEMLLQHADSLAARQDYPGSSGTLKRALALFPADSLATQRLQMAELAMSRAQRAESEAALQFRSGIDAYTEQRYAESLRCFQAALALDPMHSSAALYLQKARQACDAQQAAERREQERHAEEKRQADERRLAEERRLVESRRATEDRAPASPPAAFVAACYQRGLLSFRAGDLLGAMRDWEQVAHGTPHYEQVDQYLLRVYRVCGLESYTEGRLHDAIDIWEKALRLEPGNEQVRRYLNQAYAKLQRKQPAGGVAR